MPRTLILAAVALAAMSTTAAAKRMPPPPGPVTRTPSSRPLADHLTASEAAVVVCARRERGAVLQATVMVRWNADGTTGPLRVASANARFGRCLTTALRGQIPGGSGRASARARVVVDRKRLGGATGGGAAALTACKVDSDCMVWFRTSACVPTDPIAVASAQLAAVRVTYPVKRIECGMGGPQYDELLEANRGRWTTTCVAARCALHEHQTTTGGPLGGMRAP